MPESHSKSVFDLQTFEVDFANTARLRVLIPDDVVVVGESGLKTAVDVQQIRDIGVDAILVGETLVKSKNVAERVRSMVAAGKQQQQLINHQLISMLWD